MLQDLNIGLLMLTRDYVPIGEQSVHHVYFSPVFAQSKLKGYYETEPNDARLNMLRA